MLFFVELYTLIGLPQSDGSLKAIDVARTVWRDRVYPYPRKLINSLGEQK